MGSPNRLKLGLFGANCASGRAVTTVPERWSGSWPDCVKLAQMADRAHAGRSGVFIPSRAREQMLPDVQNGARLYDPPAGNGMPSAHEAGAVLCNGLRAHCKNPPSVHGQLAGISKLNPRRLGTRFYKSEVRSDLVSAERAGSAGKHCSSRARGDKNSRSDADPPAAVAPA